jgi:hypothetical protein
MDAMIDDDNNLAKPRPYHPKAMIGGGVALILLAAALLAFVRFSKDDGPSIPNPQTVTCQQFAGLTEAQQNKIARKLGNDAGGQPVTAGAISDGYCGLVVGPNDPVAGATNLGS